MEHSWTPPIEIETALGRFRTIATVEQAARQLLHAWPHDVGKAHIRAQKACLAVLEGSGTPAKARKAFLDACREADIFVRN